MGPEPYSEQRVVPAASPRLTGATCNFCAASYIYRIALGCVRVGGRNPVMFRTVGALGAAILLAMGAGAEAASSRMQASSPYGAYLAAQHAVKSGDYPAAAAYFDLLVRTDQKEAVAADAIHAFVANGDVEQAAQLARDRVQSGVQAGGLISLLTFAGEVRRGDLGAARSILDGTDAGGGLDGYLYPVLKAWISVAQSESNVDFQAIDRFAERGVLPSFFNYHVARMLARMGDREAASARYRKATRAEALSDRVGLAAIAHFSAVGDHAERIRTQARLSGRRPASGLVLALEEGADIQSFGDVVELGAGLSGVVEGSGEAGSGEATSPHLEAAVGAAETLYDAGRILFAQQIHRAALAYVNLALFLRPEFPAAQLLAGRILEQLGVVEPTLAAYRRVPQDEPEGWDAGLALGSYLGELDRADEARAVLRTLGDQYVGRVGALSALGQLLASTKQYGEAIEVYSEALGRLEQLEIHHWPLLYGRGAALERSGDWARAEEDLQHALELSPDQPFVLNYLAYSWIEQGRRLEEARAMAAQAAELRPDNGFIIDSLAWAHYRLGDYETAIQMLERAMAAEPGDPVITGHYGDALWRTGRRNEARLQWRHALRADPDPELAAEIEYKLEHGFDGDPAAPDEHEI